MKDISIQKILLKQVHIPTKLLTSYKTLGLNETEVMIILQIHRFLQNGTEFPTPAEIAAHLTIDEQACSNLLRKLLQKDFLKIEQLENKENQLTEIYSFDPLWEKIYLEKEEITDPAENIGTIFVLFEQEFGRPLSPFEIETINTWLDEDNFVPELIKAALRESVLMSKLNFNYIDRILRNWKQKGIHTVEQARESSKEFRNRQTQKQYTTTQNRDRSLYYNWLEGED